MTDSDIPEFFLDIFSVRALFKHDGIGLSEHKNSFIDWWMVNTWLLFSPKLERRRENLYVHFLPHLVNKKNQWLNSIVIKYCDEGHNLRTYNCHVAQANHCPELVCGHFAHVHT